MRQPTPQYIEAAQKLAALLALSAPNPEQLSETEKLRAEMRTAFMKAFDLEADQGTKTRRFYKRHVVTESGPDRVLFHNLDFFQHCGDLVIVSQPYQLDIDVLDYWAWQRYTSYTVADDWGYYHPGAAKLFVIPFDEGAAGVAEELGKTRRDIEAIRRASAIEQAKRLKRSLNVLRAGPRR